ncbi:MAG: putative rane-bound dehydrogenase [Planctomycetaceae bacterium]|nr:putative rane-bound dehydrogenase [Planctomycetaceae bacterium]
MMRGLLSVVGLCSVFGAIVSNFQSAQADEVALNGHHFTIPSGFEIELIAGPPLIDRPITAAFDEQGRLYVADSSGSNDKVDKQLAEKPHRILRLEDTDGDGKFDKRTVFADKMMFPEGTMWLEGSLYVAAPPSIWKLTDTNQDGVADERVEWFQGKTLTGCANDLHGPYAGRDGWIYWCKGAFAEQTYEQPGKPPFVTKASHIFRCRKDGSGIEQVMTGGMDNPVDTVFTAGGERIFTTTFLQHPGGGNRDGLIHAIYGGVYGKDHGVLDGHLRTGGLMPILSHLGAAAPCGLTTYDSKSFGPEFEGNLFACCFNMRKITRHVLSPHLGQFQSADTDFVVSDNVDFHPTDILEDADGSLVIMDTGGWYKLCCPTSQLPKPDVLGGIYRVRRKNATANADPRGLKQVWASLSVNELAKLLGDDRPVVQEHAIRELAQRTILAIPTLGGVIKSDKSVTARRNAVWGLTRIDHESARAAVRFGLSDQSAEVRHAALNSISLWRDASAVPELLLALRSKSSFDQRLAAECLGRIGDKKQLIKLLTILDQPKIDRALEHALRYALLEIGDAEAILAANQSLKSKTPYPMAATLWAQEQLPNGKLDPQQLGKMLGVNDRELRDTAVFILGRHPEWGAELAGILRSYLDGGLNFGVNATNAPNQSAESNQNQADLEQIVARFAKGAEVQQMLAELVGTQPPAAPAEKPRNPGLIPMRPTIPVNGRWNGLRVMRISGLKDWPAAWPAAVAATIVKDDVAILQAGIAVLRAFPPVKDAALAKDLSERLRAVIAETGLTAEVRLDALAALSILTRDVSPEQFTLLTENLQADKPLNQRSAAADVVSKAKLTSPQLVELTNQFKTVGPLEADKLLAAYEQGGDEAVGLKLVNTLKDSPVLKSLRPDAVKLRLAKFSDKVREQSLPLYEIMNAEVGKQKEKLEGLLAELKDGDIRRGQQVFISQKAACSACHAIGYLGGKVGPDLTRIGGIRTERDLLEAIVFPSASFVRSYEPVTILLTDGKVVNGTIRNETQDEIVLATGPKDEVRVSRKDIEEMRPSTVSVMPSGLDQQLTKQQLADVVAFLKAAK